MIRVAMATMFSLVLGAIYSNRTSNQKSIQDTIGLLFGCVLNQTFGAMVTDHHDTRPPSCPSHTPFP